MRDQGVGGREPAAGRLAGRLEVGGRRVPVAGRLQVIAGPMFAGKSEELMRRVRRSRLAGLDVLVVGHELDDRHGAGTVASHIGTSIPARTAGDVEGLRRILAEGGPGGRRDVVAIDEAQFFGPGVVEVVDRLVLGGTDVVVAGLCITFDATPFTPVPELMARADEVVKLTAVCAICGADAPFHVRRGGPGAVGVGEERQDSSDVPSGIRAERADGQGATEAPSGAQAARADLVGGAESYEARCRAHLGD